MQMNAKILLFLLVGLILVNSSWAKACGHRNCPAHDECCHDVALGPVCYHPNTHDCVPTQGFRLCGEGDLACGTVCYNPRLYFCSEDGRLQQRPQGTTGDQATTGVKATTGVHATTGVKATTGVQGTTGVKATTGVDATTGAKATTGVQGTTGTQATTGVKATSGAQATTGVKATTGVLGTTGVGSTTGGIPQNINKLYGLNYNPRRYDGNCPTQQQVEEDVQFLSQYTQRLKIFSTFDCNAGEFLLSAIQNLGVNMTVSLGFWLDEWHEPEIANEMAALRNITRNVGLQHVNSIVVGSETQYRGDFSVDTLANYIRSVKLFLNESGFARIPVTSAEVIYNVIGLPKLRQSVDIIMANQFPFWENSHIDQSLDLLFNTIRTLQNVVRGEKEIILGETGWPSAGDARGEALPSLENMRLYFQEFVCRAQQVGVGYYWFQAFDTPYRPELVEQSFGLFSVDKQLKAGLNFPVVC